MPAAINAHATVRYDVNIESSILNHNKTPKKSESATLRTMFSRLCRVRDNRIDTPQNKISVNIPDYGEQIHCLSSQYSGFVLASLQEILSRHGYQHQHDKGISQLGSHACET